MIGVYKITSPTNKVYVGQSINIQKRWIQHVKKLKENINCKLYDSFRKHGVSNHIFEIIEECSIKHLNERERYWQDQYNVLDETGLNHRLTSSNDKSGHLSSETIEKISKSKLGKASNISKIKLNERNRLISLALTGKKKNTQKIYLEN